MFGILSTLLKYVFITIIYLFIFGIIRLIYLDIRSMNGHERIAGMNHPYLKLINRRDSLDFRVEESYTLQGSTIVGRSSKNGIAVRDPYLSGEHARLLLNNDRYFIEDLKSTNGTSVNGKQVEQTAVPLKDGDKIHVGQLEFLFVDKSSMRGE